jgi:hypothetical protein
MDRANLSADPQRLASALSYLQQQGSPMMQEGMPQGQHMMPDGQLMPDDMMPPQQMMPDQMMPPPQAADMGRNGDTTVGHLTPGEVVVPVDLQTPQLMAALMEALGPDFGRYQVGGSDDSINPQTGMPEFYASDDSDTNRSGGTTGADPSNDGRNDSGSYGGGGFGPSDGSWGPQNADAMGNSQYGGTYDADGRYQVGSNVFGSLFNSDPNRSYALPANQQLNDTPTQRQINNAMESVHGGGFMGSLGRGLEGLFGGTRSFKAMPDGQYGVRHSINPGAALSMALGGIPGLAVGLASRLVPTSYLPSVDVRSPTAREGV